MEESTDYKNLNQAELKAFFFGALEVRGGLCWMNVWCVVIEPKKGVPLSWSAGVGFCIGKLMVKRCCEQANECRSFDIQNRFLPIECWYWLIVIELYLLSC